MRKYEQIPQKVIDLHGYVRDEVDSLLVPIFRSREYRHIRIITGTGKSRGGNSILLFHVKKLCMSYNIRFNRAKQQHGGDGALEVFL